jgi:hypothetical protein
MDHAPHCDCAYAVAVYEDYQGKGWVDLLIYDYVECHASNPPEVKKLGECKCCLVASEPEPESIFYELFLKELERHYHYGEVHFGEAD